MIRVIPSTAFAPARYGDSRREVRIGQWRLTRLLASGLWTRVFRARPVGSPATGPGDFVVKTLTAERHAEPLARAILRREALVSRGVQHPHLTSVLIDATDTATPHVVLPYLPGATAVDLLATAVLGENDREVRLPIATACLIARQAAEALAALHDGGWLHGDVQPANILVAASGHTTLLNLGLARRIASDECESEFAALATPTHAAPEMFSPGRTITPAADVYALGIVLYELLTGQPLFAAVERSHVIRQHKTLLPPDLRELRPTATADLAELLRRMFAKEPLRRPAAAQVVRWLSELEIEEVSLL
jgi:serine/threonine-protein kinase